MYYPKSEKHKREVALRMGFEEVPDESAYGGAYYIKDSKNGYSI